MEISPYPVIDLFAGPGGLGEGFATATGSKYHAAPRFFLAASIEKDDWAYKTLRLRHFFRHFPPSEAPEAYYRGSCANFVKT